jgi:hypothetical protein
METTHGTHDLIISSLIGFLISLPLIYFASQNKPFFEYKDEDQHESKAAEISSKLNVIVDEERVQKRTEKLQKLLGLSPELISKAVRQTNEDIASEGKDNISSGFDWMRVWSSLLDYIVIGSVFMITFYSLNSVSDGELMRMIEGMFRTEFDSINFGKLSPVLDFFNFVK